MSHSNHPGFAPREAFETILEYGVIPTFDLVIEVPDSGVLIARRKIAPYKDTWALPGLRMYKGEQITDTMNRIASTEVGLTVDASKARILGQFVGKFATEHNRQDISTGYVVQASEQDIQLNKDHFTSFRLITDPSQIPERTGAMYKHYLNQYFSE